MVLTATCAKTPKVSDMATTNIALIAEYDGTRYHGSQLQAKAPTIQREIEEALWKLTGERIRVKMSSRTDAGVHAEEQVVCFRARSSLPLKTFVEGLNYYLPEDIAIKTSLKVDDSFDARRSAISREYKYYIWNSQTRSPTRRGFSCRVGGELNIKSMNQACQYLIGEHDFASFASRALVKGKSTERDVHIAEVAKDGKMVVFTMAANSFLPHQVRNTAGALIKVGLGKMTVAEFHDMVQAKSPGTVGPAAPACGLCLTRIDYPSPLGEIKNENL